MLSAEQAQRSEADLASYWPRSAASWVGAAIVTAIFSGIVITAAGGWHEFLEWMKSEKCAFWVQAIGSIGAVWAAFWVSYSQTQATLRNQESAAKAELQRRHATLVALLESALVEYGVILTILRGSQPTEAYVRTSAKELMDEFASTFAELSPLDMPSANAVRSLVRLRDLIKTAAWNANEAIRRGTEDRGRYDDCVDSMEHNLGEVKSELEKLTAELP